MKVSRPLVVSLPIGGVLFAESVHEADFRMAKRADPFHKLVYVLKGSVTWQGDEQTEEAKAIPAGSILAIPAGRPHQLQDVEPATLLLLCFEPRLLEADAEGGKVWQTLTQMPGSRLWLERSSRQRLEGRWRQALLEQAHPRLGGSAMIHALTMQSLVLLARLPVVESERSSEQRVQAVVAELAEAFYEVWTVDRAAARAGVSRRRLTELFRKITGHTLNDYLTEMRLVHAAKLLGSGEHSILGAMFSCGFGDTSHFYRLFRRRFGVAPGQWTQQHATLPRASSARSPRV
ncbi:MAG TPA: helix-turn-helix domain-containing protein [Opitutaceae bacterium]|nr:helix-turn-helix domain-containing protein [Opitutaceae bacterium]